MEGIEEMQETFGRERRYSRGRRGEEISLAHKKNRTRSKTTGSTHRLNACLEKGQIKKREGRVMLHRPTPWVVRCKGFGILQGFIGRGRRER
jgi:hypothetical protein